jgi:glucose-1-phosphate thymidylyltransferase
LILDEIKTRNDGTVDRSDIRGRVEIGKGSIIKDGCIVKGPAIIGRNCTISNTYIGPYTSIGDSCEIVETEIEDSVVLNGCRICHAGRIVDSLIGKDVTIVKHDGPTQGHRFVIGDNSEIHI